MLRIVVTLPAIHPIVEECCAEWTSPTTRFTVWQERRLS